MLFVVSTSPFLTTEPAKLHKSECTYEDKLSAENILIYRGNPELVMMLNNAPTVNA